MKYVWVVTKHKMLPPVFHWKNDEHEKEGEIVAVFGNYGDALALIYKKETGMDYVFVNSRRKIK
jgi:hypothetical protein